MNNIPFSKKGLDDLKKDYENLISSRPEAVMHLKRARELGDLSENGYYKASRAKLSSIDSRLRHLKYLIQNARTFEESDSDIVELGKKIIVNNGEGEKEFVLVGGYESDPSLGRISHISPLGKALIGAKIGDSRAVISPKGETVYTIVSIRKATS